VLLKLATFTTTSNGVDTEKLVLPLTVSVTPVAGVPPKACTVPKARVAADVPLLPSVTPAPSVTKVKLTEPTVVAVTASVPVPEGLGGSALASCTPMLSVNTRMPIFSSLCFMLIGFVSLELYLFLGDHRHGTGRLYGLFLSPANLMRFMQLQLRSCNP
jgi:hypothetical protein